MLDMERFQSVLTKYIADFPRRWNEDQEYYKWEAVQHFQKTWDIEAKDFAVMLANALAKASNLLLSIKYFPAGMVIELAKAEPENVRALFVSLFDEEQDVYERIKIFKESIETKLTKKSIISSQSSQSENAILSAITTYLWLRYPDKYYSFKYNEAKIVSTELILNTNKTI